MDPTNWDWGNPATYFFVAYTIARIASHIVPSHTIVGKAIAWILGSVPPVPAPPPKPNPAKTESVG